VSPLVTTEPPRLVFGCGYLGRRVASLWQARGRRVAALTRRNAEALRERGIEPVSGDVLDAASLRGLPPASGVLYSVGLDRSSGRTMREVYVGGLSHVLDTLPPAGRFIYASSTSVYGQTDGDWVTEGSAAEPAEEAGQVVLEAEQLLRARRPDAIILRFAGLYGPGRLLRKQAILKGEPLVGDAGKWLNLVHIDDAAAVVLAAETLGAPGETYNVADGSPVARRDFYAVLAELLGAPAAKFEHRPEPGAPNRRIDAAKARAELGWSPAFPSYREGLADAVARSDG
jgi:nucleoside-diphosphate-sugar epimerase